VLDQSCGLASIDRYFQRPLAGERAQLSAVMSGRFWSWAIVLRQEWSRGQVEARFADRSPCLVGMEAESVRII
jgi:hypothetical protein